MSSIPNQEPPHTLISDIYSFADTLPYWAKFLAYNILANDTLSEEIISQAYSLFIENNDLNKGLNNSKSEIKLPQINKAISGSNNMLTLLSLKNVTGVNALIPEQEIPFSENLTIIFGANGSGKSGYTRLLKQVFFSRDKEIIIPDINKQNPPNISAEFTFKEADNIYNRQYPQDISCNEFSRYAVFDDKASIVYLSNRNSFEFRPRGLEFFSTMANAYKEIERRLHADIENNKLSIDYTTLFDGDSSIKKGIENISTGTNIEDLKKHLPFSNEDETQLTMLEKKRVSISSINYENQIRELEQKKQAILKTLSVIDNNNKGFKIYLVKLHEEIKKYLATESAIQKEGISTFKTDKIQAIGNKEWKAFILAANKFAITQEDPYPSKNSNCLLCHQELSSEAKYLIEKYWLYVNSTLEQDLQNSKENLNKWLDYYNKFTYNILDEDSIATQYLSNLYPTEFPQLLNSIKEQKEERDLIISDIKGYTIQERKEIIIDTSVLEKAQAQIESSIQQLQENSHAKEIQAIEQEMLYLRHKKILEKHISDIDKLIKSKIWENKAESCYGQLNTRSITDNEKRLSSKYFNDAYTELFNNECKKLKANFGIEISHTGSRGSSYKQLKYKNYNPTDILSIGEQKAVSMADFFAEIKLSETNSGAIFDDPVSSLDDERKQIIAQRLVEESKERQIIVFTHDLVFVSQLIQSCQEIHNEHSCHWIENSGNTPGRIWSNNTPSYEKAYKTSHNAKEYYNNAKKASPQLREQEIKNGFAALRTSYEALVVFDLFSGVVQRFTERVSIESLSNVFFSEELKKNILDSFSLCCRYMEGHSHSDKYAYIKPTIDNLNEEILRFDQVKKAISSFKKSSQSNNSQKK